MSIFWQYFYTGAITHRDGTTISANDDGCAELVVGILFYANYKHSPQLAHLVQLCESFLYRCNTRPL